jgi:hypothetical protein
VRIEKYKIRPSKFCPPIAMHCPTVSPSLLRSSTPLPYPPSCHPRCPLLPFPLLPPATHVSLLSSDEKLRLVIPPRRRDSRPVRRGVSQGVEDSGRPPTLRAGHSRNSHKAVSGSARSQGVGEPGMAGQGETVGSPWIPFAIRARGTPSLTMAEIR